MPRRVPGLRLALTAAVAAQLAAPAAAAPSPPPPGAALVDAVTGGRGGIVDLVLIGSSGEIYLAANGAWSRASPGGIGPDVLGATRASDGTLFAVGARGPVYRHASGRWQLEPPGQHGDTVANTRSGVPALAVADLVYTFSGETWRRFPRPAPGPLVAVWASSPSRVFGIDAGGRLLRGSGRSWSRVAVALSAGDSLVALMGAAGGEPYAVSAGGSILQVRGGTARAVTVPAALAGARLAAATADRQAAYALLRTTDGRGVVVRLAGAGAEPWAELPPRPDDDPYVLLAVGASGAALAASRRGDVRLRDAAAAPWRDATVAVDLPAPAAAPIRAQRGPALSR